MEEYIFRFCARSRCLSTGKPADHRSYFRYFKATIAHDKTGWIRNGEKKEREGEKKGNVDEREFNRLLSLFPEKEKSAYPAQLE